MPTSSHCALQAPTPRNLSERIAYTALIGDLNSPTIYQIKRKEPTYIFHLFFLAQDIDVDAASYKKQNFSSSIETAVVFEVIQGIMRLSSVENNSP